ncbi:MAG: anhydro-N-acetylmuramic acid kinase [Gammaproteobacteria bacterium]|nr:anhydro-N-acetylmuramic acid kinase [Gammaproteobacteria bacterium]
MVERYIGIMSGTSLDGVDAVLVEFDGDALHLLDTATLGIPRPLRDEAEALVRDDRDGLNRAFRLGNHLTEIYAEIARQLAARSDSAVAAIGCHGQTLRHFPADPDTPFTIRVVNGAMLAVATGIATVTDFRRADMALGGQGAPLAPAFHAHCPASRHENRVILNLGGIANLTWLPAGTNAAVTGFDTGPANGLMDQWARAHGQPAFDVGGALAASGTVDRTLLAAMASDPYFRLVPPKSTGREHFGAEWLKRHLAAFPALDPADIQATLLELTAISVADALRQYCPAAEAVYACGGGCRNPVLMARLAALLEPVRISDTAELGIDPQWVEATAFAWLARRRLNALPGNLPSVTGASRPAVLGALYLP